MGHSEEYEFWRLSCHAAVKHMTEAMKRADAAEARLRDAPLGGAGSHWEDCWRSHIDCAVARVEAAEARAEKAENTLGDIMLGAQIMKDGRLYHLQPSPSTY